MRRQVRAIQVFKYLDEQRLIPLDRYVEDRIYTLCGGLISNCVVVGSGKPSPALIVEPNSDGIVDEREVIRQLGDTLTSINKGGYPHERISPKHILLVSPGELPRTFVSSTDYTILNACLTCRTSSSNKTLFVQLRKSNLKHK